MVGQEIRPAYRMGDPGAIEIPPVEKLLILHALVQSSPAVDGGSSLKREWAHGGAGRGSL